MATFTTNWFTFGDAWSGLLGHLAGRPGVRLLEIGSWEGQSACWLLTHIATHPSSTLTCVDTFEGSDEHKERMPEHLARLEVLFDSNVAETGGADRVRKLKGESRLMLRTLEPASFDFIYVDGSHVAADVLTDAVLGWDLLKTGGIMVFDDYEWKRYPEPLRTPKPAIDAFLAVYADRLEVLSRGWQVTVRKR